MNKILKKKSFGFGKKKFGSDTDTFDQYHNRYRILVSHYKKHMTWSVCRHDSFYHLCHSHPRLFFLAADSSFLVHLFYRLQFFLGSQ